MTRKHDRGRATTQANGLEVRESASVDDPAWDDFVAGTPGGHHVQTTHWARVKALADWHAERVIMTRNGRIAGGGQMLVHHVPLLGSVGYVPKGPLFGPDEAALRPQLIRALVSTASSLSVRHLTIQPPNNGHCLTPLLTEMGFRPTPKVLPFAPSVSLLIDLHQEIDDIMAQFGSRTRYNVRLGLRKGVTVREGSEDDLDTYYRMLRATAERQGFITYPEVYYRGMWRALHPHGFLRLFLAEYEGEVVSGQLLVPFRTSVTNKLSVWSGRHGSKRPNEVLQWHAIQWSHAQGFRYYDFEGIDVRAVEAAEQNAPIPAGLKQTVTSFKLGFGGIPVRFPAPQSSATNRIVTLGYESLLPAITKNPAVARIVARVRTGG
jgi:lipid II:glycine glycyltransferase (peptidoglycan interpeptide bridge formation enzyme)